MEVKSKAVFVKMLKSHIKAQARKHGSYQLFGNHIKIPYQSIYNYIHSSAVPQINKYRIFLDKISAPASLKAAADKYYQEAKPKAYKRLYGSISKTDLEPVDIPKKIYEMPELPKIPAHLMPACHPQPPKEYRV